MKFFFRLWECLEIVKNLVIENFVSNKLIKIHILASPKRAKMDFLHSKVIQIKNLSNFCSKMSSKWKLLMLIIGQNWKKVISRLLKFHFHEFQSSKKVLILFLANFERPKFQFLLLNSHFSKKIQSQIFGFFRVESLYRNVIDTFDENGSCTQCIVKKKTNRYKTLCIVYCVFVST